MKEWTAKPNATNPHLTQSVKGANHQDQTPTLPIVVERFEFDIGPSSIELEDKHSSSKEDD